MTGDDTKHDGAALDAIELAREVLIDHRDQLQTMARRERCEQAVRVKAAVNFLAQTDNGP